MSFGLLATVGVMALGSGCGSNAPCTTDPSQVDTARDALASAEQDVESAKSELSSAESRKNELNQDMSSTEDTAALREHLETLKKGSGR
jgi:outer membrane murein-binding lipoprotein Lpp